MSAMLRELTVMNSVAETMKDLTKDEQHRILMWLLDYFDAYGNDYDFDDEDDFDDLVMVRQAPATAIETKTAPQFEVEIADDLEDEAADEAEDLSEPQPKTLASFFEQVAPKTAIQKIATAAYWLETEEQQESWKSFQVNKVLKSLGIKVSSVSGTLALEGKKDKPLVAVLEKSGDSMQARKTFRLSDAGMDFVEERI